MEDEVKKYDNRLIRIRRARHGSPCYWENNREFETMKRLSFVYDENGLAKDPIFVQRETGERLVPIVEGDYILKIFFERNRKPQIEQTNDDFVIGEGIGISLLRITEISKYNNTANTELVERKPSDSTQWILNENAIPISSETLNNVKLKIKEILNNKEN